jgi:hypothetical protein
MEDMELGWCVLRRVGTVDIPWVQAAVGYGTVSFVSLL